MIDSRILNTLKSRNENPAYSILITGYDVKNDCNQEKLVIHLHQINKSLNEIENMTNANIIKKDFIINSDIDYDSTNNALKSTLIGYINNYGSIKPPSNEINNYANHYIEMIETELKSEIEINFNHEYQYMPSIIPTIPSKYKSYYKDYDIEFIIKTTEEEEELYTGVKIIFNRLKRKNNYPLINIAIIGDAIND